MEKTLEFPVLLQLIDERSIAFRAAVVSAPALDLQVPTCPEWTLLDLVQHLGEVHRFWAETVNAGPATAPPDESAQEKTEEAPGELEALLAWSAESTRLLLDALRGAGPDSGCWTWWGESQSPQTAGAVARHQVQEAMVHAYDAQIVAGDPRPLPDVAAGDGVDEFLTTCCEGTDPWPHKPGAIDFHATDGRGWRISLSDAGSHTTRLPERGAASAAGESADVASASARGSAAELVLALYGRIPIDSLELDGDRRQLELFRDWD